MGKAFRSHPWQPILGMARFLGEAVAIVILTASASLAQAGRASVQMRPGFGPPQSTATITGGGFRARERVRVEFGRVRVATITTSSAGRFSTAFAVPGFALPGPHSVRAVGGASGRSASASFVVRTDWQRFHWGTTGTGNNRFENVLTPRTAPKLRRKWAFATGGRVESSPAVVGGMVYVGSDDGYVYAIRAKGGTQAWRFRTGGPVMSSPTVAGTPGAGSPRAAESSTRSDNKKYTRIGWATNCGLSQLGSDEVTYGPADCLVHQDRSVFRHPVMLLHGHRVRPHRGDGAGSVFTYYELTKDERPSEVGPFPSGMRMVGSRVWFSCAHGGAPKKLAPYNCRPYGSKDPRVSAWVYFPTCWDGTGTGPADVAYPTDGVCPSGKRKRLPHLVMQASWDLANGTGARFTSGDASTFRATFTNGWDWRVQAELVQDCLNKPTPCGSALNYLQRLSQGGMVYVGSDDGNVYGLNATTGAVVWSYRTGGPVRSSPAVLDGVVYVGSNDGRLYALGAKTGARIWSYAAGGPIESSPALLDGVVYVGSNDSRLYAIGTNGRLKWSFKAHDAIESSPAVAAGSVVFGSNDSSYYSLNSQTGRVRWKYQTERQQTSSPAIAPAQDGVFLGLRGSKVVGARFSDGALEWTFAARGPVLSSPALADDVLYVGGSDGYLYALRSSVGRSAGALPRGAPLVSRPLYKFFTHGPVNSSPAVANGMVFVGSDDGHLYALGLPG